MLHAILTLNYAAALVAAVVGFVIGAVWFSPVLFLQGWLTELKFTVSTVQAAAPAEKARILLTAFVATAVYTTAVGVLVTAHGSANWLKGAELGAFVGIGLLGGAMALNDQFEKRSWKLWAINAGHEVVVCTVAGAIFGAWR